jgi:hypothetical protein
LFESGVDVATATLDYTGVDTSNFGEKKLSKEQVMP